MTTVASLERRTYQAGACGDVPGCDSRWFDVTRVLLLVFLMAAPFAFGAVESWAWAGLVVGSGAALIGWFLGCCASKRLRIHWSAVHLILLLAMALVSWQLLGGRTVDYTLTREALIKFVGYGIIFFLTGQMFATLSQRGWRLIGISIVIYAFAVAVFAIVQFLSAPDLVYWTVKPRWGGYIFGPYINHNHYAGLMELLVPLAIATVPSLSPRHGFKWFAVFAVALAISSVVLSGSRGGTGGLAVEMAIFLAVMGKGSRGVSGSHLGLLAVSVAPKRTVGAIVLGLAMVALGVFSWLDDGTVWKRWTNEAPELAAQERKLIAADGMRMWKSYPIAGVGAGAFGSIYPRYQAVVTDNDMEHAHNDFVELVAETGALGAVLALGTIVVVLRCGFQGVWSGAAGGEAGVHDWKAEKWMRVGAAIACCGLLVHSFTDFNLHMPANAAWFAMCAGLAAAPRGN